MISEIWVALCYLLDAICAPYIDTYDQLTTEEMLLLLTLITVLMLGSFFMIYGLIYRSMYKRLRYLALSECEFKEKKGELRARHPLMKENRWEPLTEAYNFASQPRTNLNNLTEEKKEILESREQENKRLISTDEQYEPGQWKTKEDVLEK